MGQSTGAAAPQAEPRSPVDDDRTNEPAPVAAREPRTIMAKTYSDLFADVRSSVRTISLEDLKARLDDTSRPRPVLVDVREKDEFRAGYIPGAIHLPRGFLEMQASSEERRGGNGSGWW